MVAKERGEERKRQGRRYEQTAEDQLDWKCMVHACHMATQNMVGTFSDAMHSICTVLVKKMASLIYSCLALACRHNVHPSHDAHIYMYHVIHVHV